MCSGVHWRAASGFPENRPDAAAASGAVRRPGGPTAAVRRIFRNSWPPQHHCRTGTSAAEVALTGDVTETSDGGREVQNKITNANSNKTKSENTTTNWKR